MQSKIKNEYEYKMPIIEQETLDSQCIFDSVDCTVKNHKKSYSYELLEKDSTHLFAKIRIGTVQGEVLGLDYNYEYTFYNKTLKNINQITITFFTPDGKLIDGMSEHDMTLEIIENYEVLKETLLDTKLNIISSTGAKT